MVWISLISFLIAVTGIAILLGLNSERVSEDIKLLFSPVMSLKQRALLTSGRRKKSRLAETVLEIKEAIEQTGKKGRFGFFCIISFCLVISGPILLFLTGHFFYIPILTAIAIFIPFFVAEGAIETYTKRMTAELETALSVVSSAYLRLGNIIEAVEESLPLIHFPVENVFREFLVNTKTVSPDVSACIKRMQNSIDNRVFKDWCEVLLACVDDSSNRDALLPVVSELTEIRLANSDMATTISECRKEYFGMALITIGNIPLLYFLNKSWWNLLLNSVAGQIALSFCGCAVVVTAFLMMRYTRPLEIMKKVKNDRNN